MKIDVSITLKFETELTGLTFGGQLFISTQTSVGRKKRQTATDPEAEVQELVIIMIMYNLNSVS